MKALGSFLILTALLLFLNLTPLGQEITTTFIGNSADKLSLQLKKELNAELIKSKRVQLWLPASEVLIERLGPIANSKISEKFDPFEMNLNSQRRIEITILDLEDTNNPGIIFQMSLIDLKTKNKVDELGYTHYYSKQ